MTTSQHASLERRLIKSAALLLLLALLTGFYISAAAMKLIDADMNMALASHLNGLLGAFWLLGLAYSLRYCHGSEQQLSRVAALIIIANYSNWLITAIKAYVQVSAIAWIEGQWPNNLILVSLTLLVVFPALGGSIGWVLALFKAQPER